MTALLETFKIYTQKYKWMIIPLEPNSKRPIFPEWNKQYNIESAKSYFEEHPDCNMGLILGEVIDVEADSVSGNNFLNNIIKDYPHPKWKSNKSIHHLFLNPEKYTRKLTRKTFQQQIEFRGFNHQSVLPPSMVGDIRYDWLPDSVSHIPIMPKSLFKFYMHSAYPKKNEKNIYSL